MIREETIKKLELYNSKKRLIHITCSSKRFYNGWINKIDRINDWVIFIDKKIGEIYILIKEIINIEPYFQEVKE